MMKKEKNQKMMTITHQLPLLLLLIAGSTTMGSIPTTRTHGTLSVSSPRRGLQQIADTSRCNETRGDLSDDVVCPDLCGPGQDLEYSLHDSFELCFLGGCNNPENCGTYLANNRVDLLKICTAYCTETGISAAGDLQNCVQNSDGSWQCTRYILARTYFSENSPESGVLVSCGATLPTIIPDPEDCTCSIVLTNPSYEYTSDDLCQDCKITKWNDDDLSFDYDCSNKLEGDCVKYDSTTDTCTGNVPTATPNALPTTTTPGNSPTVSPIQPAPGPEPSDGDVGSSSSDSTVIVVAVVVLIIFIIAIGAMCAFFKSCPLYSKLCCARGGGGGPNLGVISGAAEVASGFTGAMGYEHTSTILAGGGKIADSMDSSNKQPQQQQSGSGASPTTSRSASKSSDNIPVFSPQQTIDDDVPIDEVPDFSPKEDEDNVTEKGFLG